MKRSNRGGLRAALLTPVGEGGISVIALWGTHAAQLAARRLKGRSGKAREILPGRLSYGFFCDAAGEALDEIILACAGDDRVEINCHGGLRPAGRILESLRREGVAIDAPDAADALRGAGLIEREAVDALIRATTDLASRVFAAQAGGALRNALDEALRLIDQGEVVRAADRLNTLRQTAAIGMALARAGTVAVVGPANAGKSALVNRLAGYERNIVTEVPGTTRDAVRVAAALFGVPVALIDTAGVGVARDALDAVAAERALAAAQEADAVIAVIDVSAALPASYAPLERPGGVVVAANKADLAPNAATLAAITAWGHVSVETSALTGQGTEELSKRVLEALGAGVPDTSMATRAVVFTQRQVACVEKAIAALNHGRKAAAHRALASSGD